VLQYTGIPHITVHDELDFSRPSDDPIVREAFDYAQRVLEGVIKLRVPLLVDRSEGPNWGEAK
jgi:DNA polymerase I-like protein with 3'-5' exonuclease and polymerase domains